ncbi:MAG: hypothetical protein D6725_09305, partial [Planctomycetota bacterium]
ASGETASVATAEADPAEEDSGDAAARYADVVTWPDLIAKLVGRGDSRNGRGRSGRGRRRRRR